MTSPPAPAPRRRNSSARLAGMALLVLAGCAPGLRGPAAPSPAEIARLEAQLAEDDSDVDAALRLGVAYRSAGRLDDARSLLEEALQRSQEETGVILFLGLTYEDLGNYSRARELYERYLEVGRSRDLKKDLEQRLALLRRRELAAGARAALNREAELAASSPQPRTVAVFPFRVVGPDSTLEPLGRALAEMLTTDLSQTNRLEVLERLQVQVLLEEMELTESGLAEPETGVRGGRILRAERVVQGAVEGNSERVQLDAAVVRTAPGAYTGAADPAAPAADAAVVSVSETDALERLIEAEKRLALKIYSAMGIQLTAAEREQVNQRPTENLQALLAYGRGLQAADAGDFRGAAEHFSAATALDPGFTAAQLQAATVIGLAGAVQTTTGEIARRGAREVPGQSAPPSTDGFVPDPAGRDAAADVLGTEGIGRRRTILEVIIRRPTGGE